MGVAKLISETLIRPTYRGNEMYSVRSVMSAEPVVLESYLARLAIAIDVALVAKF